MPLPRIVFRTVPAESPEADELWAEVERLHPGWITHTWRDPLPVECFPLTSPYWDRCSSGAQKAGLVRLEALYRYGGIYLDSDVRMWKPLDSLVHLDGFVIEEAPGSIIDAVIAARAGDEWLLDAIELAIDRLHVGALQSGPQAVAEAASDAMVLVLDQFAFAPYTAWHDRATAETFTADDFPNAYGLHLCRNSWGG